MKYEPKVKQLPNLINRSYIRWKATMNTEDLTIQDVTKYDLASYELAIRFFDQRNLPSH
jgi:hypothetical protein